MVSRFRSALVAITFLTISVWAQTLRAQTTSSAPAQPIHVPLMMVETAQQTDKAMLQVGVGSLQPFSIPIDTGSVGLVLFASPGIPEMKPRVRVKPSASPMETLCASPTAA
jgi:hypothetical protein